MSVPLGSEAALAGTRLWGQSSGTHGPLTHAPAPGSLPVTGITAVLGVIFPPAKRHAAARGASRLPWPSSCTSWTRELLALMHKDMEKATSVEPGGPRPASPPCGSRCSLLCPSPLGSTTWMPAQQHRCLRGAPRPPHTSPPPVLLCLAALATQGSPRTGHHHPGAAGCGWGCAGRERSPSGRGGQAERRGGCLLGQGLG